MVKFPCLTGKQLGKIVEKFGFELDHQRGSHLVYKHPDGRITVIPHHSGETLGPGLLNKIIKRDLKISREEFMRYVK